MNIYDYDILNFLFNHNYTTQRYLSEQTGFSIGKINQSLRDLVTHGYLTENFNLTPISIDLIKNHRPQRAIILAAGYGIRMIPANMNLPKALIEVYGETLIERIIEQLHENDIYEIYIVVGYMKERFDFLVDKYDVKLIINTDYSTKNNLHSLALASDHLSNSYIIPCDIWFKENPFKKSELYSWYMVGEDIVDSDVRLNRKCELTSTGSSHRGNAMIGLSYISFSDADALSKRLKAMDNDTRYRNSFWEDALFSAEFERVYARVANLDEVYEIDSYEQLKELDEQSSSLNSTVLELISEELGVKQNCITNIEVLKKGMTNRSFKFSCGNSQYIMRIPGEGANILINRAQEFSVYKTIDKLNLCDDLVYIDPDKGYKLTRFIENARVCDPFDTDDVKKCMAFLREMHLRKLEVNHFFDIFERIEFYEQLRGDTPSVYRDYEQTKANVLSLKEYLDKQPKDYVLTHIDAVPDNFLIYNENGHESIRLIDWEYASMQDPHVDIAMFAIYSMYDHENIDRLIDTYFIEGCEKALRLKIYCYIALCGLLWSNWCEFKLLQGVDFGEYSLRQYRYAKDYYRIFCENMNKDV